MLLSFLIYRHVLARLHFNENLRRDLKQTKDGKTYMHVTFPKFKMGEEVVREIAEPPSYGMTGCLLLLLLLVLLLLLLLLLLSVINCSPEHNSVLRLQYTYQHYTGTDNNIVNNYSSSPNGL